MANVGGVLNMDPLSVSYTHLDVYKRQMLMLAIMLCFAVYNAYKRVKYAMPAALVRLMTLSMVAGYLVCLLYTSRCV